MRATTPVLSRPMTVMAANRFTPAGFNSLTRNATFFTFHCSTL
jgi:hypothetical protein